MNKEKAARILATGIAVGAAGAVATDQLRNVNVNAQVLDITGQIPSQQPLEEALRTPTPKVEVKKTETKERIQEAPDNPYIFVDDLNRQRVWSIDNLRFGISPNNSSQRVGTIDNATNSSSDYSFQPKISLDSSASASEGVVVGGAIVDVSTKKGYILRANSGQQAGVYIPRGVEVIMDFDNPTNYADGARLLNFANLPQGGTFGDTYSALRLGNDSQGKYLEIGIKNSINSAEDGTYRLRLDNSGIPVGGWSIYVAPVYKANIPHVTSGSPIGGASSVASKK